MALILLQVLVLGVIAAAADDVPVTWWHGPRAVLPCVVPAPGRGVLAPEPALPLRYDDPPSTHQSIWRKGGVIITGKRILANGSLEVTRTNEGVYQCETVRSGGKVLGLPINIKFASISRQFSKHPENATARAGQPFALSCEIRSSPPAEITWLKDGLPLPEDLKYYNLTNQLLILDIRKEDAGVYVCIARNPFAQNRTSFEGTLAVVERDEELLPALLPVHHEQVLQVINGSRVELACPVVGWPRPKLIWEHTPTGQRRSELELTSEVFVMPAIQTDMEGYFSCVVEGNSQLVKNFNVSVIIPPEIIEPPVQNNAVVRRVYRAGTTRFNCTATGQPPPVVTWYKDGVPIPAERIRNGRDRKQQLVIGGITSDDAGVYQCFARSGPYMTTSWSSLVVVGRPVPPPQWLRCVPLSASSVLVSWGPSADRIPLAYVLRYHAVNGNIKISKQPHQNKEESVTLPLPLKPYVFKVQTFPVNSSLYTASDYSDEVTCQGQGVPIELTRMKGDNVKVSWEDFASSNPEVVSWMLQYRNGSEERNYTYVGNQIYTHTLHAPKSSPLQVRVLGSRTMDWLPQNLTLVPWISTNKSEKADRTFIPAPSNVNILMAGNSTVEVSWSHEDGGGGGGRGQYQYQVCVKINGEENCHYSAVKSASILKYDPDSEYEIRIRAQELAGDRTSEFSPPIHIPTKAESNLGPPTAIHLWYKYLDSSTLEVSWEGKLAEYIVYYRTWLEMPVEAWDTLVTTKNSVQISGLQPNLPLYVMVSSLDPPKHSQIITVPPRNNDTELRDLRYEHISTGIQLSWTSSAPRVVRYSQNITAAIEQWTRVNIDGSTVVLSNLDPLLPTHLSISVGGSADHMLTIPPAPAQESRVYLAFGIIAGVLVLILMVVVAICFWRRRKRMQSPLRSRRRNTGGSKSNEEEGSEMKSISQYLQNVGGRLANGGGSKEAGEPLLNGHVHITENPTSKTPNGKLRRGRVEASLDLSRGSELDATQETVLEETSTAYSLLDTSRTSYNKLPDDNMNELTHTDNSTIQPTLQPNG